MWQSWQEMLSVVSFWLIVFSEILFFWKKSWYPWSHSLLRLNLSIIIWLFSKTFPHCALSWLTSGPTRDEFLYNRNWSKSFLSLLKSRPSCRPSSSKSSWCFKKGGLISEFIFILIPSSKNCAKSLSSTFSIWLLCRLKGGGGSKIADFETTP